MTHSMFEHVDMAPVDPILGITEAFKSDESDRKINLGVGAYRTEKLEPLVLSVVRKAEEAIFMRNYNKEYLPIEGLPEFNRATALLLLGTESTAIEEGRVATIQGLSGTGSLRLGAEFISRYLPDSKVYLSSPTWGNHENIFRDAGVQLAKYRYFDLQAVGLDLSGMLNDLQNASEGSVILLHACAHNPTGVDPTKQQWEAIADIIQQKRHIPFFDIAYQGFASGDLDQDASAIRYFVHRGIELLVAQSYSKNLGLYSERVGALNLILNSAVVADRVKSQIKRIARAIYSNPPSHGAWIVATVVSNPSLFQEWKQEIQTMASRIQTVRKELFRHLMANEPRSKDWSFVLRQIGMFSFTGLNSQQVENMTKKWHVYMTSDGRISLAGLSISKAEYLSKAIIQSYYHSVSKL